MEKENITFEEALVKLQESVNKLEKGEIKLDEAFDMFEQGFFRFINDALGLHHGQVKFLGNALVGQAVQKAEF